MRVLVAPRESQGTGDYDFFWCDDEELVYPIETCSMHSCGCGRAFIGIDSERATTTAKIVDRRDLDRSACLELIEKMLADHDHGHPAGTAELYVDAMRAAAARGHLGAVMERQGSSFRARPRSRWREVLQ